MLVRKKLLSPEWAERVGKYMIRLVLALERLTFLEPEGKVGYRWGRNGAGQETEVMDYLEFIARVTSHIPDKGQVYPVGLDRRRPGTAPLQP
jgi:ABC-type Na+ transport system ATPase subunit NatA